MQCYEGANQQINIGLDLVGRYSKNSFGSEAEKCDQDVCSLTKLCDFPMRNVTGILQ